MKKYLYPVFVGILFIITSLPLAAQTGNLNGILNSPEVQTNLTKEQAQAAQSQAQAAANLQAANGSASNTTTGQCPPGMVRDAGVCFPTNTGLSEATIQDILITFMNWLLGIVGMIAIIAFVITGMQYLAAVGDAKLAETAKKNMLNSIIGIVVALSGFVILQAIDQLFTAQDKYF
ncbi:MAG: pilin [Patescibacteria group bacterium]